MGDVCEGRCHKAVIKLEDLHSSLSSLEKRVEELEQAAKEDLKTQLALEEAAVHQLEKRIDNSTAKDLAEASPLQMQVEEARIQKKDLLGRTDKLLAKIEGIFE